MQFFKTAIRPYTQPEVFKSCFEEHEDALQHHLWLAQSPDLKRRVRSRFPPLSLKQLEEEWYSIPLQTVQGNGGPTPY